MRNAWKLAVRGYPFAKGRGKLIAMARQSITGIVVVNDHQGNRLLLDLDNHIDSMIFLEGGYEDRAVANLAKIAKDRNCDHFIDAGANIGVYSLRFARDPGYHHLWAFEPDPRNFKQFAANLWLNRVHDRVTVSDVALSATDGDTTFYVSTPRRPDGKWNFNTGTSSLLKAGSDLHSAIKVQMRRLDQMVKVIGQNILIKIDVEGAEQMVLDGAAELMKNNKCLIMLEIWSETAGALEKMINYMSARGYHRLSAELGNENYLFGN